MKYLTVAKCSQKWQISKTEIQELCLKNCIKGAKFKDNEWMIPVTASNPKDRITSLNINKELHIEDVVIEYGSYLYNFAYTLTTNPKDAEDLVQETFIKAWINLKSLKNEYAIKKWLRTICLNEFRRKLKKENRIKIEYTENLEDLEKDSLHYVTPKPSFTEEVIVSEEVAKLRDGCFLAMTRKLTIHQRLAFSLIDMFGMSIYEVAKILEITPKAVKGLLYRARMNLEAFFKNHCSILDTNNPCQCTAWMEFIENRAKLQEKLKETLDVLDYQKSDYTYDSITRQKILYYYQNMPEKRPNAEWFLQVITLLENYFK